MRRPRQKPNLVVAVVTPFTATVRGRAAHRTLQLARVSAIFNHRPPDGGAACWTIPAHAVADAVAAAERLGGSAQIAEAALW